jgi:hypothetical protein
MEINKTTGELISIDIDSERLSVEEEAIYEFLDNIDLYYNSMSWDGKLLKVVYEDGRVTEATRQELEEYIDCLDLSELLINIEGERSDSAEDYRDFLGI